METEEQVRDTVEKVTDTIANHASVHLPAVIAANSVATAIYVFDWNKFLSSISIILAITYTVWRLYKDGFFKAIKGKFKLGKKK